MFILNPQIGPIDKIGQKDMNYTLFLYFRIAVAVVLSFIKPINFNGVI